MWATSVIFEKLLKANNRPLGENSSNLVTLPTTVSYVQRQCCKSFTTPRLA
jgi:hypothetical protein